MAKLLWRSLSLKTIKIYYKHKPEKSNSTRKPQNVCVEIESHRTLKLFADPTFLDLANIYTKKVLSSLLILKVPEGSTSWNWSDKTMGRKRFQALRSCGLRKSLVRRWSPGLWGLLVGRLQFKGVDWAGTWWNWKMARTFPECQRSTVL
jgi:hypothetical protein